MQEVFEKITERLEQLLNNFGEHCEEWGGECRHKSCSDCVLSHAIEIVDQVAEEYGHDINVGNKDSWIQCRERLPGIYTPVLITYRRQHDGYSKVVVARMQADCEWKIEFGGHCDGENVLAWQPLPEPYKEKDND